jgi:hypothetical protein
MGVQGDSVLVFLSGHTPRALASSPGAMRNKVQIRSWDVIRSKKLSRMLVAVSFLGLAVCTNVDSSPEISGIQSAIQSALPEASVVVRSDPVSGAIVISADVTSTQQDSSAIESLARRAACAAFAVSEGLSVEQARVLVWAAVAAAPATQEPHGFTFSRSIDGSRCERESNSSLNPSVVIWA